MKQCKNSDVKTFYNILAKCFQYCPSDKNQLVPCLSVKSFSVTRLKSRVETDKNLTPEICVLQQQKNT